MNVGKGRKMSRKAFVQRNFKHLGNFLDISSGGCSLNSQVPLEQGRLLMIEFEIDRTERITAFGKVRRMTGKKDTVSTMHIMFTKVTSHNLNNIYSYVYNYVQPRKNAATKYRLTRSANLNTIRPKTQSQIR